MILVVSWVLLSLFGLLRGAMLLREAILDRHALGRASNGRSVLANWQVEHAVLGMLIYWFAFVAGASAFLYYLEWISLHFRLLIASGCLVAMLVALVVRQERDAYYRKRNITPFRER